MLMTAPNGVRVDASEEAVQGLLAMGFKPVEAKKPQRKAPARKRTRKKEQ